MVSSQTEAQRTDKSQGDGAGGDDSRRVDAAAKLHGMDRGDWGFHLGDVVAEYRALRASVLRLWRTSQPAADLLDLEDVTRFNESIDQSLTEAVESFTEHVDMCREELAKEQSARVGAEAANRAKDDFLATLSHEMRTPLNAIVGWLTILRAEGCEEEDLQEGLAAIDRNTKAQVQLITDILDVSRIVTGKLGVDLRPCDLKDVIEAGVDVVRPLAVAKDIALDVRLDSSVGRTQCDPARMQQVVWNLLSNAVKFTPKGGTVRIALARDSSALRLDVSDTGQGIAAGFLPHVFDRFRQADSSTRRKHGGLGLGLSIAKHLVELFGGTIEAHSAGEGLGAMFTVRLPIIQAHSTGEPRADSDGAETEGRITRSADASGPPPVRLDGLRVLVVDDEADARRMLARVLQSVGAVVTTADGAADALAALQIAGNSMGPATVDVLVSDLGMPDQDGYDLIREVRRRGYHARDLPAIAVTGFAHRDDARKAVLAGFQAHLPKPVDLHDLTAVIASLAGRTH